MEQPQEHQIRFTQTQRLFLTGALLVVVSALLYLKTFSFGFVNWDDDENIRTNHRLQELSYNNARYHFLHTRYKTLAILSYTADQKLFGNNASGYHMHNLLLHALNVLLIFILLFKLTKKERVALIAAGLFALHPVFVETVAWVTGRKDLLFMLYSLLSMLAYRKYILSRQKVLWLSVTAGLVFMASLAKIQAFTLPLIFFGFDHYYGRKVSVTSVLEKLMLVAFMFDKWIITILLFLLVVASLIVKPKNLVNRETVAKISFWYVLAICLVVIAWNLLYKEISGIMIRPVMAGLFVLLGAVIVIMRKRYTAWIKGLKFKWVVLFHLSPLFIFGGKMLSGDLQNLIPATKIWTLHQGDLNYFAFGERFILAAKALLIYFSRLVLACPQNPMIPYPEHNAEGALPGSMIITAVIVYAVLIAFAVMVYRFFRKNRAVILGLIWFFAGISIVMHIIPIEGRVLAADRYAYPSFAGLFLITGVFADYLLQRYKKAIIWPVMGILAAFLFVKTFMDEDVWRNSKTLWEHALKADGKNHYAMYSLSLAYFVEEKNPGKAREYADRAIQLSDYFQYYNNRGRIRHALNDMTGALDDFNKSIAGDRGNFAAYNNRGATRLEFADFAGALRDYDTALLIKPDYGEAIHNREKLLQLITLDRIVASGRMLTYAERKGVASFISNTAQKLIDRDSADRAAYYLNRGIMLLPDDQSFYEMLAVMYHLNKRYTKALSVYDAGLKNLPGNASLLLGRGFTYLETGDTLKACGDWREAYDGGNREAGNMIARFCRQ